MDRVGKKKMANSPVKDFETFEHGADIGIRGFGLSMEEAFQNGARAVFSLMVEELSSVKHKEQVDIQCNSYDIEGLFVAWLNELLAQKDMKNLLFSDFLVNIDKDNLNLSGVATGEIFDGSRHVRGVEVKGATFSELLVKHHEGFWIAQCVVDV